MGEPLIIVTASSILGSGWGPGSVQDIYSKTKFKLCFKYPFDGGKILSLADCFERNKIVLFFVCLATADSISISVLPTKDSRFITKKEKIKAR